MGAVIFLLAYLGGLIWCTVIAVQKGRTTMAVIGWLICSPLIVIAACRIGKPTSKWAREKYQYDPMKLEVSKMRFPKEAYLMKQLATTDQTAQVA